MNLDSVIFTTGIFVTNRATAAVISVLMFSFMIHLQRNFNQTPDRHPGQQTRANRRPSKTKAKRYQINEPADKDAKQGSKQ